MSREILLKFAKGSEIKPLHVVVYDIDTDNGGINIHSCDYYSGAYPEDGIWIHVCTTKEDVAADVSEEEIKRAVAEYLKVK